jgi:NADH-quinone oxidoreductase subunit G
MATIYVDGEPYEVNGANNLLHDCLSLGLDIPYFCWHPELGSIGACRACAVKQFNGPDDKTGRIVMSCMTQSTDKTYISINDEEAKDFRKTVVEWLMTNHPHDCPVCEEGGHCHLQDMTVMVQHNQRRYRYPKRTHLNQDLGPFINHEMNRCIACYRCVRYYNEYAGGADFGVYGAHDNLYFGRERDGILQSEFSGNLTEVCPTGVFTDRTHSTRYNRKWDMQFAPSVCQQCAIGCNISPGERYGELRRIENRYHGEINHYFLCDRGRFGYGYVNNAERPRKVECKQQELESSVQTAESAVNAIVKELRTCTKVIGIGSPRASVQSNFALRQLLGEENFFSGFSSTEHLVITQALQLLQNSPVRTPTLRDMESCDAILILGEDVTQTAPRIALAVRQAIKNQGLQAAATCNIPAWQAASVADIAQQDHSPLFITSVAATKLDNVATATYRHTSEIQTQLGFAVAHAIDATMPTIDGLNESQQTLAQQIATALNAAKQPLIIAGTACGSVELMQAAFNIALALHRNQRAPLLSLCVPEVNSMGAAFLGGKSIDDALNMIVQGAADGLIILENDLFRRASTTLVETALTKARVTVAIDHQRTPTAQKAQFVLPASSFAEGDGTVISMEGRAQRYFQVYDPVYYDASCIIKDSWAWLYAIKTAWQNDSIEWVHFDDITHQCANSFALLAQIDKVTPDAAYRIKGQKIARAPRRYSGRTAMRANLSVYEPKASQDEDSPLAFSMEGYTGPYDPSPLIPFAWAPGWNSPQAWTKFQTEVGGSLKAGDSGIRLIEPKGSEVSALPKAESSNAVKIAEQLQVVPLYHLFGSEELSSYASIMKTVTPPPYLAIHPDDAAQISAREHNSVTIVIGENKYSLPLRMDASLTLGTVGLPVGICNIPDVIGIKSAIVSVNTGDQV